MTLTRCYRRGKISITSSYFDPAAVWQTKGSVSVYIYASGSLLTPREEISLFAAYQPVHLECINTSRDNMMVYKARLTDAALSSRRYAICIYIYIHESRRRLLFQGFAIYIYATRVLWNFRISNAPENIPACIYKRFSQRTHQLAEGAIRFRLYLYIYIYIGRRYIVFKFSLTQHTKVTPESPSAASASSFSQKSSRL